MMTAIRKAVVEPANWKATASAIGAYALAGLAFVASLAYDLGPIAVLVSPEWKAKIVFYSGVASAILWSYAEIQKHLIRNETAKQLKHRR